MLVTWGFVALIIANVSARTSSDPVTPPCTG